MYPVLVCVPDYCLGSRADYQFLLKACGRIHHHSVAFRVVLEPVVGYHGAFLGKAFHMVGFAAEERFRDEEREICVLVPCGFEHVVELTLHLFPDCIAIRLDHHTAAHGRLFGQISFDNQLVVPLGVVVGTFCEVLEFFCHDVVPICWFSSGICP